MGVLETRPLHTQSRATAALQSARGAGNGRRNKEARRNGEQAEGGEIDKARLVGYVLPRGVGIIAPWAVAANGTGCFALVETADKSRKLNRRHRLSIRVPRARRTRRVDHHKKTRFISCVADPRVHTKEYRIEKKGRVSIFRVSRGLGTTALRDQFRFVKYFDSTIKM